MPGNAKKQFVAQSVICIEKLTTGKRTCLKRISTSLVFLVKIIEEETSVHIVLQVG